MQRFPAFPPRLRGFVIKGALALATLGAAAVGAGATAMAHHDGWHGHALAVLSSPDELDRLLQHVYVEVGADAAQQAQLAPLLRQAASDLQALRGQVQGGHGELLALLTQPQVDRAALEAARAAHVQAMDAISRRLVQLVGDVSDVLTLEQRQALAARIAERHGPAAP